MRYGSRGRRRRAADGLESHLGHDERVAGIVQSSESAELGGNRFGDHRILSSFELTHRVGDSNGVRIGGERRITSRRSGEVGREGPVRIRPPAPQLAFERRVQRVEPRAGLLQFLRPTRSSAGQNALSRHIDDARTRE